MKKDVNKSTRDKNVYIFILEKLDLGFNASQISKQLGVTRQALTRPLSSLKQKGLIKYIGYGIWERCKQINPQDVNKSTRIATFNPQDVNRLKPDSVRGHGFQFTFSLPKNLRNWDKRREILAQMNIPFRELRIFGGGEQLNFKGRKIWLTNKSIVIFEKESYITETAKESKSYAIAEILEIVKSFEKYLKANFEGYRFRVSRQHYSLIKNALAKQYDKEGKKLEVYNDSGLWFLIDNSFNLHEAETLHPKTADVDNEKMQTYFNKIKETSIEVLKDYSPQFVVNSLGQFAKNNETTIKSMEYLDYNLKTHFEVLNKIAEAVTELKEAVKEIKK